MARSKAYVVHPAAWAEIEAAADWYQKHSEDAAVSFLKTILDALDTCLKRHNAGLGTYTIPGDSWFSVSHFIIFLDGPQAVNVLAIAPAEARNWWKRL